MGLLEIVCNIPELAGVSGINRAARPLCLAEYKLTNAAIVAKPASTRDDTLRRRLTHVIAEKHLQRTPQRRILEQTNNERSSNMFNWHICACRLSQFCTVFVNCMDVSYSEQRILVSLAQVAIQVAEVRVIVLSVRLTGRI